MEISLYPGVKEALDNIRPAQKKAEHFGKKLTIYRYEQFRTTFGLKSTTNHDMVKKIFTACKIANFWGCHAVREGYIYNKKRWMAKGGNQKTIHLICKLKRILG